MNALSLLLPFVLTLSSMSGSTQSGTSSSGTLHSKDLPSPVRKGSRTTYFEVLRLVLPDLQVDSAGAATAHKTVPVRNIAEKKEEATALEGNFEIDIFEARWLRSEGTQILLLNIDLSAESANEGTPYAGEASIIAAFNLEPTIKLLDIIDAKTDRFTDFWEQDPVFQLSAQNDAFVIHNTHFNAGESYDDLAVVFVDGERFKIIMSIFLFNTQGCGATFTETPYFRALPNTGRKYPALLVRVKVKKDADPEECDHKTPGYTKYYQATYHWNGMKAKYEGGSRQFDALYKFNGKRL